MSEVRHPSYGAHRARRSRRSLGARAIRADHAAAHARSPRPSRLRAAGCAIGAVALLLGGCARAPSPLAPQYEGSIGLPNRGVLVGGSTLDCDAEGLRCLRDNDRHHGTGRFVAAIARAAKTVNRLRPGSVLTVGDISARAGGKVSSHASHRSGRDADLLLYLTTLDGVPVPSPDFVHVGTDGLAFDPAGKRWLRLDVERQWLLVKSLVEDPDARIQWLFVSRPVRAMLLEWARARGESVETLSRAMDVLVQPAPPAQNHDDHLHARTACSPAELARGCEASGPVRPWIAEVDENDAHRVFATADAASASLPETEELLMAIVRPMGEVQASARTADGDLERR